MNPETKIMREIMEYLNTRRIYHVRINADVNTVGVPDILVCYKGRFIGLEVKTERGRPSGVQKATAEAIKECGGVCVFPTNVREVEDVLSWFD